MSKAEPRFDVDLAYGRQAELQIEDFLTWVARGNARVEVKRKRYLDHRLYVETHCDRGRTGTYRPSGILTTTSALWVFCIGDLGVHVAIPTPLLREMLEDPSTRDVAEADGQCPTRGKLIDFCVLLWRQRQRQDRSSTPRATC